HVYVPLCSTAASTDAYTLSLHDALPISRSLRICSLRNSTTSVSSLRHAMPHQLSAPRPLTIAYFPGASRSTMASVGTVLTLAMRSEEHTSELQSRSDVVCRPPLETKNKA